MATDGIKIIARFLKLKFPYTEIPETFEGILEALIYYQRTDDKDILSYERDVLMLTTLQHVINRIAVSAGGTDDLCGDWSIGAIIDALDSLAPNIEL